MLRDLSNFDFFSDDELINGRLPNGLTYYIRKNTFPQKESYFCLIVKAGTINEEENEKGVAHFVEHVALNEYGDNTEHMEMFAYTDFNCTCYSIRCFGEEYYYIVDALTKLKGISQEAKFCEESIYKEREMISKEIKRVNNTLDSILRNKIFEVILNNSQYQERIPIDKSSSIDHIEKKHIVDFYRKWYCINNMAIVAIGDFDVDKVENMIKEEFSQYEKNLNVQNIQYYIPDYEGLQVAYNVCSEIDKTSIAFYFKRGRQLINSIKSFKDNLVEELFFRLMVNFININSESNATYYKKDFSQAEEFIAISIELERDNIKEEIENILKVMLMAIKDSTLKDLNYIKQSLFKYVKNIYDERNCLESRIFFNECIRSFITDEPIMSIENEFILVESLLEEISIEEITNFGILFFNNKNLAIVLNINEEARLKSTELVELIKSWKCIKDTNIVLWDKH